MWLDGLEESQRIYFIGIGGVSMSSLAKLLLHMGYAVSGSDLFKGEETQALLALGVEIRFGKWDGTPTEKLLTAETIVYTDAVPESDGELCFARRLGKKVLKRGELLSLICRKFSYVTAVAGSHGKTTCSAMCAHILHEARVPFAAHIGGFDSKFGNFHLSGFEHFLTEACEYKKNLLYVKPDRAILLNIDLDHMECYGDERDLIETFAAYCRSAKTAFVCADDKRSAKLGDFPTFGIEQKLADYRASEIRQTGERYSFTVAEYGRSLCRVRLNVVGRCNVYNALAAFAAMRSYGFGEKEIARGLETFSAVKRRFEEIGKYRGGTFICDYAHHPREILSSVKTARKATKRNLYVVFQPHTYSRTKLLMKEFAEVLSPIKNLIVYKTYAARERYDEEGSAETLAKRLGSLYAENIAMLKAYAETTVGTGDCMLFLGAGDIYYAAKFLLNELNHAP